MKNKIIGITLLGFLILFPFRYLLSITEPADLKWLLSLVAVMLGYVATLFIFISKPFESKALTQPELKKAKNEAPYENVTSVNPAF